MKSPNFTAKICTNTLPIWAFVSKTKRPAKFWREGLRASATWRRLPPTQSCSEQHDLVVSSRRRYLLRSSEARGRAKLVAKYQPPERHSVLAGGNHGIVASRVLAVVLSLSHSPPFYQWQALWAKGAGFGNWVLNPAEFLAPHTIFVLFALVPFSRDVSNITWKLSRVEPRSSL